MIVAHFVSKRSLNARLSSSHGACLRSAAGAGALEVGRAPQGAKTSSRYLR